MPAVSGSPTQLQTSAATPQDLSGLPDDAFKDGDLACVRSLWPQSTFRLRRATLGVAPNNVTAIATFSGNGYWELFPQGGDLLSFPTVASLAAFDDQNLDDGAIVYIESLKSYWSKVVEASPGAVDNITYVRNPSNTASWYRNEVPSLAWQSQTSWYIRSNGNDEDPGTLASPLKTFAEFNRRVDAIGSTVTVTILDTLTERPMGFFTSSSDAGRLVIIGTPTINTSSIVSDVPTYTDPIPGSNLRGTVAAASINFAGYIGKLVQTADGYIAPVLSSSGATGYTPFWVKSDETIWTPAGGTALDVFTPCAVPAIRIDFNGPIDVHFIRFTEASVFEFPSLSGSVTTFWGCEFVSNYHFDAPDARFLGCLFSGAQINLVWANGGSATFIGGGSTRVTSAITGLTFANFKGFIIQGGDFQVPNSNSTGNFASVELLDTYGLGIFGAAAVGLTIRDDNTIKCGTLYGVNGTYGVSVLLGGSLVIADGYTPTITGTTSDFIVDSNAALTTISPLVAGAAVPTAKDYSGPGGVGWGKWHNPAGDFKRKLVSYSSLSKIVSN